METAIQLTPQNCQVPTQEALVTDVMDRETHTAICGSHTGSDRWSLLNFCEDCSLTPLGPWPQDLSEDQVGMGVATSTSLLMALLHLGLLVPRVTLVVGVELPNQILLVDLPHLVPWDLLYQQQLRRYGIRGHDVSVETQH